MVVVTIQLLVNVIVVMKATRLRIAMVMIVITTSMILIVKMERMRILATVIIAMAWQ